jgi:hypothetical protein
LSVQRRDAENAETSAEKKNPVVFSALALRSLRLCVELVFFLGDPTLLKRYL